MVKDWKHIEKSQSISTFQTTIWLIYFITLYQKALFEFSFESYVKHEYYIKKINSPIHYTSYSYLPLLTLLNNTEELNDFHQS